jgi:hypothetical protein
VVGEEEAISAEILLRSGEIRERNSPVFVLFVDMVFVTELIGSLGCTCEVTFVILAIFFKCDFRSNMKERRKEMGSVQDVDCWLGDDIGHVHRWDGRRCAVIVQNKVVWRGIGIGCYVHNSAGLGVTGCGVYLGHTCARSIRFTNRCNLISMKGYK